MVLPDDIESQILKYLHLEYGEDADSPSALKIEELVYEGVFDIEGMNVHYWKYPSHGQDCWATVEPYENTYCIGMTTSPPRPIKKDDLYKKFCLYIRGGTEFENDFELEDLGNGSFGFSNYKKVDLPNGESLDILVEGHSGNNPPTVAIGIIHAGTEIYLKSFVGVVMSFQTQTGFEVIITFGKQP